MDVWASALPGRLGILGLRAVSLGSGVARQLAHVGTLGHLLSGESPRGACPEVDALHAVGRREFLGRVGPPALDASREDAEVGNLHRLALQHQLADAVHHVGQNAPDDTLRVGRVVLSHVLGQLLQRHHLAHRHGACVPLAEHLAVFRLVLVNTIENAHSRLAFVLVTRSVRQSMRTCLTPAPSERFSDSAKVQHFKRTA